MDFIEKVVLITGASSGIGAATAIYFAKQSAQLVLVGRKERNLKRIAMYCEKLKGSKPFEIIEDISTASGVEGVAFKTLEEFGRLDVLINNAGVYGVGGIKTGTLETYDKVMSTNLRSVFYLTKLLTETLIKSKGCIVNVSCGASKKIATNALAYTLSKTALDHFTKCVALELAPDGVRVNSVSPGFVKTNLYWESGLTQQQLDMFVQNVVGTSPLKRQITGEEVAAMIGFLAGDNAQGITGSSYVLDAGMALR